MTVISIATDNLFPFPVGYYPNISWLRDELHALSAAWYICLFGRSFFDMICAASGMPKRSSSHDEFLINICNLYAFQRALPTIGFRSYEVFQPGFPQLSLHFLANFTLWIVLWSLEILYSVIFWTVIFWTLFFGYDSWYGSMDGIIVYARPELNQQGHLRMLSIGRARIVAFKTLMAVCGQRKVVNKP
jgi:hypothetical protein